MEKSVIDKFIVARYDANVPNYSSPRAVSLFLCLLLLSFHQNLTVRAIKQFRRHGFVHLKLDLAGIWPGSWKPDVLILLMRRHCIRSSCILEIKIVMMPRIGEFEKDGVPRRTKPELEEASCSLTHTNNKFHVSSLAGQFHDEHEKRTASAFFANHASRICVGITQMMQLL